MFLFLLGLLTETTHYSKETRKIIHWINITNIIKPHKPELLRPDEEYGY